MTAAPEFLARAATDLSNIGSELIAANAAATASTTAMVPAAGDEISAAITSVVCRPRAGLSGAECAGVGVSRPVRAGVKRRGRLVRGR
ncbi:hypothetical protein BST25_20530 [Mycobacterium heidelbergense]|uniref:PE domain-containing protein n=1 Tax=Mycobacterium heidelbergense TaxID=53376 RepID=A0A1X0DBU0_MYCHE|nr:hypothetical protein BST25_20530 [Mycobacterium heidelbergense]